MNQLPKKNSPIAKQQGFTLIELMIALVLGLLISAAALQLFTGSILSSRMQQANDELQNSGIFGLDYIVRDIRLANYDNVNNPELNEQTSWGGNCSYSKYWSSNQYEFADSCSSALYCTGFIDA